MKRKIAFITCLILFSFGSFSQNLRYALSLIPDSLRENADVVIRYDETILKIIDHENAILKVKEVKTILKKSGIKYATLIVPYSEKFEKIISIEGAVYDQIGIEKSRIKKTDINDEALFDGFSLYTDNRKKYVNAPVLNPPYTVEYEYEIQMKGLYGLPDWSPVTDEKISVENSRFIIQNPTEIKYYSKEINCDSIKIDVNSYNGITVKTFILSHFKAINFESYNNRYSDYFPLVKFRLDEFKLAGYYGRSETWEELGNWKYQLIKGKDILSDETGLLIQEIIESAKDDYEKAKIIYEFMQKKTRYVNISEGIGGLQPVDAETVDKIGYGDCKALSNYTMSLLKIAGIKAHYTSVYAGSEFDELLKDFPSHQSNHIILCLPIENDTIWLECTNQDTPFGYIGSFTDDRDVLLIDSNGKGKIAHTTSYPEEVNTLTRKIAIAIDETGYAKIKSQAIYSGLQYDFIEHILNQSDIEKEKELNEMIAIPNMKLNSFSYVNIKERIPSIIENLDFSVIKYVSLSSGRMFLVPNILNKLEEIPGKIEKRKTEIIFRRGFTDIDTIVYKMPQGYEIEYMPENISKNSKFGTFDANYSYANSTLTYVRKYVKHKGTFPPEDYDELREFIKTIYNSDKKAVVFIKK